MGGFITERDFATAEREFPGIQRFYESLARKPATFLQLVWAYEHPADAGPTGTPARPTAHHDQRRAA
jgi:hypothetical protein